MISVSLWLNLPRPLCPISISADLKINDDQDLPDERRWRSQKLVKRKCMVEGRMQNGSRINRSRMLRAEPVFETRILTKSRGTNTPADKCVIQQLDQRVKRYFTMIMPPFSHRAMTNSFPVPANTKPETRRHEIRREWANSLHKGSAKTAHPERVQHAVGRTGTAEQTSQN